MTSLSNRTFSRRSGMGMVASAAVVVAAGGSLRTFAQTPEASPAADVIFPDGPLGEHAMWLLEVANAGPGRLKMAEIDAHFDITFFETTPASVIFKTLTDLQSAGLTYEIDPGTFITTRDMPATNGRFVLVGSDDSRTEMALTINRETELIATFVVGPEGTLSDTAVASPEASPAS